jgi:cell division protein FtsB
MQIDHTLGLLKDRAGVAAANAQLHEQAKVAAEHLVKLEARAQESEAKVLELQAHQDYVSVRATSLLTLYS